MKKTVDCPLSLKSWEANGSFSGYASVFGITDFQGEKVAAGAFAASLQAWAKSGKMPKLLWQHDYHRPIGFWREIREDSHGLFVKGQLLLDLVQGCEAYTLLKNGVIDGLSIGFIPVKARRVSGKNRLRILEEVNLQEISLVTFAANPGAKVEQVKENDPDLAPFLERLDQLGRLLKGQTSIYGEEF